MSDEPAGTSNDAQWRLVHHCIAAKQPALAREALKSILARNPSDTAAMLFMCGLDAADDHPRAATAWALAAARADARDPSLLGDVIAALLWAGEIVAARAALNSPVLAAATAIPVLMRAAGQRQAIGEHAAALGLMQRAHEAGANGRDFLFHHAVQLAFNGRLEESRAGLEQCIALDPPHGRAFVQLARMRRQTLQSNHLHQITAALQRHDVGPLERAAILFARYKELEDLQRFGEAWGALAQANAIMRQLLPCDTAHDDAVLRQLMTTCGSDFLHAIPARVDDGPQPIFVIGLPRSGTTVLERMLGNHSQVRGAGELEDFPRAVYMATDHLAGVMLDETTLARLPAVDWRELGDSYLAQTRWRARGKRYFVDKLPRNWMLAGLIRRALPGAHIINVVRDPLDVCFSNWRAFFGPGAEYAYAYDIDALAHHHAQYRRVTTHWHTVMPGQMLDVAYPRLVREPEATLRAVLAFCGLPYEPRCADLASNATPSATLSMSQVRQPLRIDTFEQWRPYAESLDTLRAALAVQ